MIIKKNNNCCCAEEIHRISKLTYLLEKNTVKLNGLTSSQANTIMELLENNSLPMNVLSKRIHIDNSTLSRNIQKLIELNLVEKKINPTDKRITVLSLTEEGVNKALEIKQLSIEQIQKLICNLSEEDFSKMFQGVSLLLDVLEKVDVV